MERALDWGNECEPDLVVDDGGDATWLIHMVMAEEEYEKSGKLADLETTEDCFGIIRDGLAVNPRLRRD